MPFFDDLRNWLNTISERKVCLSFCAFVRFLPASESPSRIPGMLEAVYTMAENSRTGVTLSQIAPQPLIPLRSYFEGHDVLTECFGLFLQNRRAGVQQLVRDGSLTMSGVQSTEWTASRLFRPIMDDISPPGIVPYIPGSVIRWQEGTVFKMALSMYETHEFDGMPVLADAMEEAGYGQRLALHHLRSPRPHYRGCWLLDALLKKEP